MEAIIGFGSSKSAGLVGSVISVLLVIGGTSGRAEGISQVTPSDGATPGLLGSFSSDDLAQLEHATTAEATATRLAALGAHVPEMTKARPRAAGEAVTAPEVDLFPHSGRLLPMLVARPDAAVQVASAGVTLRPGLVQPVGVSTSSTRSPTPAERAAR